MLGTAFLLYFTARIPAQMWDGGFVPAVNGLIYSLAVQPDGRVVAGGLFTTLNGQTRNHIGRLNPFDASLDTTFTPDADGAVYCLAAQPDGSILAGGDFTQLSGQPCGSFGRLDANGIFDTNFLPAVTGGPVYCTVVQTDGKILLGGAFASIGGQPRSGIGRINADGTLDTNFTPSVSGGSLPAVRTMAIQSDGKILVGGDFTNFCGTASSYIGRLNTDGTPDTTFNGAASGVVRSLAAQADDKILVGGDFAVLDGQPHGYIGRLNKDGSIDTNFNAVADKTVQTIALQTDGEILLGGAFSSLCEQSCIGLGRLNADGTLDPTFNAAANSNIVSLAIQPNGGILAAGNFTILGGITCRTIGRLSNTASAPHRLAMSGSTLTWTRTGAGPEVWRATFDASTDGLSWISLGGGTRVSGGWGLTGPSVVTNTFFRARGFAASGCGNGCVWYAEDILTPPQITSQPVSCTTNAGSTVVLNISVTGTWPSFQWRKGGTNLNNDATVSGASTAWLTLTNVTGDNTGAYSAVLSNATGVVTSQVATLTVNDPFIVTPPTNQLGLVGQSAVFSVKAAGAPPVHYQWRKNALPLAGATAASLTLTNVQLSDQGSGYDVCVTTKYGAQTSSVATLSINSPSPDQFNPSPNGWVSCLAPQTDGKIVIAGAFTSIGGQTRTNIARLNPDGTVDSAFSAQTSDLVLSAALQQDKVIVTGFFGRVGGVRRPGLARFNSDGTLDASFTPALNNWGYALAVQADGKIVVGGCFTPAYILRLNPDGAVDSTFTAAASNNVYCLAMQPDGKILAGGLFSAMCGQPRNGIARLNPDGTLDTVFNPGANNIVLCLTPQPDGKILVGGSFTSIGGQSRPYLARLNSDGSVDSTFNAPANANVRSLVLQADGKILVGGDFTTLSGMPRNGLARLNPDGTLDLSFAPGGGPVYALTLQPDGKIVAGGTFSQLGGQTRKNLGRLNATDPATQGLSSDDSSVLWLRGGTSPEAWRTSFDILINRTNWIAAEGQRVAGGWQVGNLPGVPSGIRARAFIASGRYNGSIWTAETNIFCPPVIAMQPASRTNLAATVATFSVQAWGTGTLNYQWTRDGAPLSDGGKIAGVFTSNLTVTNVLPSDVGGYSVIITNAYGSVTSAVANLVFIDPIIVSQPLSQTNKANETAWFWVTASGAQPMYYQWQKDGTNLSNSIFADLTLYHVLNADIGSYSVIIKNQFGSVTSSIATLTVLDPCFTSFPVGQTANLGGAVTFSAGVAGTAPLSYQWRKNGAILAEATNSCLTLTNLQQSDVGAYDVLAANSFGSVTSSVAVLEVNLAVADSFNPGALGGAVSSLAVQADGKILIGGSFTNLSGKARKRCARLNSDGSLDDTFPDPAADGQVNSLLLQTDGRILLAGGFTTLCGQSRARVGRLNSDGSLDTGFNPYVGDVVKSMALLPDGRILLGGSFYILDGQVRVSIGRLNNDGSLDFAFNPVVNSGAIVQSIVMQADNKILVAGSFTALGGQRDNIARLNGDGSLDTAFSPVVNGAINTMAIQGDGKILIGGTFYVINGVSCLYLARLNADGSLDATFKPNPNGFVNCLVLQADGGILAGGTFTNICGRGRNYIARLNIDGSLDTGFNPGADTNVSCLAIQPDGQVLAGGSFTNVSGQNRFSIARLASTAPATQNLSFDGSTLAWQRGGAAPEIGRATFEFSTNGTNWASLGNGARMTDGWSLANVWAPSNSIIRARGFVAGGPEGSGWFVESLLQWVAPPPQPVFISPTDGQFGFLPSQSNQFGFNFSAAAGQLVVVETSTNLVDWVALRTNSFGANPIYFSDPVSTNCPVRFYRGR